MNTLLCKYIIKIGKKTNILKANLASSRLIIHVCLLENKQYGILDAYRIGHWSWFETSTDKMGKYYLIFLLTQGAASGNVWKIFFYEE